MFRSIEILFDRHKEYSPTKDLKGIVKLNVQKPVAIKHLRFTVSCGVRNFWREYLNEGRWRHFNRYYDQIRHVFKLDNKTEIGQNLPIGIHQFPFSFAFPKSPLPDSGVISIPGMRRLHLRYYNGTSRCVWLLSVRVAKQGICSGHLDQEAEFLYRSKINIHQEMYNSPNSQRKEKDGITINGSIPRTAYEPGDVLQFDFSIRNKSQFELWTRSVLNTVTKATAKSGLITSAIGNEIMRAETFLGENIEPSSELQWPESNSSFKLSEDLEPTIDSKNLSVTYHLCLMVGKTGTAKPELKIVLPLVVGRKYDEEEDDERFSVPDGIDGTRPVQGDKIGFNPEVIGGNNE